MTIAEFFGVRKSAKTERKPAIEYRQSGFYWKSQRPDTIVLVNAVDALIVASISSRYGLVDSIKAEVNGSAIGTFVTVSAAEQEVRRYIGGPISNNTEGIPFKMER